MVQKIPGTNIGASADGFNLFVERATQRFGLCFSLLMCLVSPLMIALMLFGVTLAVASLVFAVQALVVGSATYQEIPCERTVGVWLIVYGSLVLGTCMLNSLCGNRRSADEEEKPQGNICTTIANLASLASFGWLCYGISIVYGSSSLKECNPSQYAVFEIMVLFMFYGTIAVIAAFFIICATMCPLLWVLDDEAMGSSTKSGPPMSFGHQNTVAIV